ncbi:4-hydroxy-3-methylbut-2-enyl diphosphate reductase [Candidatus Sumerlaeota bacterium]|nr:4-hydroxy-3-methylbut-2-enyl diphosphate reductase [Candidatus Sumerlaeota bacterium]
MSSTPPPFAPRDGVYHRGFGLKSEIRDDLQSDYHSELIQTIRDNGNRLVVDDVEIRLAKEFGFCYGVDKAVDFAYETRRQFPDRRIFLTAEIIHNPKVNRRLMDMGIEFLSGQYAGAVSTEDLRPGDVVLMPAFGVAVEQIEELRRTGCVLVDTTCGSVVHVWKRVESYARDGFTSLIHGQHDHEETIATASHAASGGQAAYIVVADKSQAGAICDFIRTSSEPRLLQSEFEGKTSPGFDFERDLVRVGVANQTTMLSSESMEIGAMVREAMIARYGADSIDGHFRSFDTICHATQERQDAVEDLMSDPPDLMIVIGGFNSSNTHHLCEIAERRCPAFHIEDAEGLISPVRIRHKPTAPGSAPIQSEQWLPAARPLRIGVTAGASPPNQVVGAVIQKTLEFARQSDTVPATSRD